MMQLLPELLIKDKLLVRSKETETLPLYSNYELLKLGISKLEYGSQHTDHIPLVNGNFHPVLVSLSTTVCILTVGHNVSDK